MLDFRNIFLSLLFISFFQPQSAQAVVCENIFIQNLSQLRILGLRMEQEVQMHKSDGLGVSHQAYPQPSTIDLRSNNSFDIMSLIDHSKNLASDFIKFSRKKQPEVMHKLLSSSPPGQLHLTSSVMKMQKYTEAHLELGTRIYHFLKLVLQQTSERAQTMTEEEQYHFQQNWLSQLESEQIRLAQDLRAIDEILMAHDRLEKYIESYNGRGPIIPIQTPEPRTRLTESLQYINTHSGGNELRQIVN